MASLATKLGLTSGSALPVPSYATGFIAFNFFFAYGLLSSRTIKQLYGLDNNKSPREDLAKYGDAAVRSGKITQSQLDMMRRNESAHANAVENFTLFVAAVGFATFSGVEPRLVNRGALIYTVARAAYAAVYILIDDNLWSQIRGVTWWMGNTTCFWLLWKAGKALNAAYD